MKKKIFLAILAVFLIYGGYKAYQITDMLGIFAEGNKAIYDLENVEPVQDSPLDGKNIIFLGSSVTEGMQSRKVSFVDYIAKRDNVNAIKEAVSGTTLTDTSDESYVSRLKTIDKTFPADMVVVQLSTNDATQNLPLGEISDSKNLEDIDPSTITGAIEYIIAYSKETWNVPVVFYTGTYYDSAEYKVMVERLHEIEDKWGIGVIDMYNDEELNNITDEQRDLYMNDGIIHPTKAGYLEWWTPVIEQGLIEYMN